MIAALLRTAEGIEQVKNLNNPNGPTSMDQFEEEKSLYSLSPMELTREYLKKRREFRDAVRRATRVSRGSGGIFVETNRLAYASILFTRITVMSKTISALLPDCKPREHWDFSSVVSLARNLVEAYIWYYWLCEDDIDETVRQGRFILTYCHDHGSRVRMFHGLVPPPGDHVVMDDLVSKFDGNSYLRGFSEKARKDALRGHKTPFVQGEIIERMGTDKSAFRFLYRFLSQHTHTGPIAFMRMLEHDRGTGVETAHEKRYMILAAQFSFEILNRAIDGHLKLFPNAEERKPYLTDTDIIRNVERNQGRVKLQNMREPKVQRNKHPTSKG